MKPHYASHGGSHLAAVVHCPRILGDRLAHLSQDGPNSWVLRDYLTGQMLRNSPDADIATSTCTLAQIEAEVTYSEEPLFHPADDIIRWKRYLGARTKEVLGRGPGADPPNPRFGRWRPLA
ncbi:MAG TPA: hypothetical protein VGA61_04550 [Anaerolineae bacterium]